MTQQGAPTVGDTITIVQHIIARAGVVVDARPPADSAIATLIAAPLLTREGDSVRIAYTVAVWTAGHNDLVLPGAVLVDQRGHVDTLADTHYPLDVASVLPAGKSNNAIAPHASVPWVPRADRSDLPFFALVPPERPVTTPPALTDARLGVWLAAGESRLALDHLDAMVRSREDFAEWRHRVAAVRFAPTGDSQTVALVEEAWARLRPPQ
jgi:hypothetical protein